jgi:hypothetical protein
MLKNVFCMQSKDLCFARILIVGIGIVIDYGLGNQYSISAQYLSLSTASVLVLGSSQPPTQWVPGDLSLGGVSC